MGHEKAPKEEKRNERNVTLKKRKEWFPTLPWCV
jgi:hypothetical protein